MIIFCYHNGALGHSVEALIECCTKEGAKEFPVFVKGKNLHHYKSQNQIFQTKHPHCDVAAERKKGNTVISSSSYSHLGRLMILLMGLEKWTNKIPQFDDPAVYKQYGSTYGEQVEILSLTLLDKINHDQDWFLDADWVLDILDFWNNTENVFEFLKNAGFTPIKNQVDSFCKLVASTNQEFYNKIINCNHIVTDIKAHKIYPIDLTFYEVVICYILLLRDINCHHSSLKVFTDHPTNTKSFLDIFNEQ